RDAQGIVDFLKDRARFGIGLGEIAPHADGLAALSGEGECRFGHESSRTHPGDWPARCPQNRAKSRRSAVRGLLFCAKWGARPLQIVVFELVADGEDGDSRPFHTI